MKNQRPLVSELVLLLALVAVVTAYVYYYLILPQDWTLRDDYIWVRSWGRPGYDHWGAGRSYLEGLMSTGRFQPIDTLSRILHYRYLPITPRAFHVSYFALAAVAIVYFWHFLRAAGAARSAALLAVLVAVSNLSFKEWLTTLTVSESWATTFLCIALAYYAAGRRWLAVPFYVLSFLSKEGFVVGLGAFAAYEVGARARKRKPLKTLRIEELGALAAMTIAGVAFAAFIHRLPREYTSGLSFSKIALIPLLKTFVLPAVKSFGPALALLALGVLRHVILRRQPQPWQWALASAGFALVVAFTVLLNAWGPFDSWFYLHLAIPFGWAMVFAAFWAPLDARDEAAPSRAGFFGELLFSKPLEQLLLGLTFVFFLLSAMNGGRNTVSYFAMAKKAAEIACEENERVSDLRVYTNCNEGAEQLREYLILSQRCSRPPKFHYLGGAPSLPASVQTPYLLVLSSKCDPFDQSSATATHGRRLELDHWAILKAL